jgi:ATP-dependent exoDNAse (exonuclease V) beta subunit
MLQKTDVIKKEQQDTDQSMVRLMTVHASKGLQAKIVILADATSKPRGYKYSDDVLWFEDPAQGFIWPVGRDKLNAPLVIATETTAPAAELSPSITACLYVALTRAEHELVDVRHEASRSTRWARITRTGMISWRKALPRLCRPYVQTNKVEHDVTGWFVSFETKELEEAIRVVHAKGGQLPPSTRSCA